MRLVFILLNAVLLILMAGLIILSAMYMKLTPDIVAMLGGKEELLTRLCEVLPLPIAFLLGRFTSVLSRLCKKKEKVKEKSKPVIKS